MSKYKVFLSMDVNDSVDVNADKFYLYEQERELTFYVGSKIIAIFNWDSVYGFSEVTE